MILRYEHRITAQIFSAACDHILFTDFVMLRAVS